MPDEKKTSSINEGEIMSDYGYSGSFGKIQLKAKLFRSWILHSIAYSSPQSSLCSKTSTLKGSQNRKKLSHIALCLDRFGLSKSGQYWRERHNRF